MTLPKNILATLGILLCCYTSALAQVTNKREALRGLTGIAVWYKVDPDKLKEINFSLTQLSTDVTLRLRKAGIRVLEGEDDKTAKGWPHLVVSVTVLRLANDMVIFDARAELLQWVYLHRQLKPEPLYLPTWTTDGFIGTASERDIEETLRKGVADVVDRFSNDYLAANPK